MKNIKVIETRDDFVKAKQLIDNTVCYGIVILSDCKKLPQLNSISLFIVESVNNTNDLFVFPINHNDASNIDVRWLLELRPSEWKTLYSKEFKSLIDTDIKVLDLYSACHLSGVEIDIPSFESDNMKIMKSKFFNISNVNSAIPIYDLISYGIKILEILKSSNLSINEHYNDVVLPSLLYIEQSGIKIDRELFEKYFSKECLNSVNLTTDIAYHEYNPYTMTGRATAVAPGLNYTAIPHDERREAFISRYNNGKLVLMDFEAHHLRLISNECISMKFFLTESIHATLGKQYFNTDSLTADQYQKSKSKTFKLLYSEYEDPDAPEFFKQVYKFKKSLWSRFIENNQLVTSTGRIFQHHIYNELTESKLFNYFVQHLESVIGVLSIQNLQKFITERNSNILPILYIYDGILFDFPENELDKIPQIAAVMGLYKYPVKISVGTNYYNLKEYERNNV